MTTAEEVPRPENAWKLLDITNDLIRHADAKAGVTLAFAGATATALFKLLDDVLYWNWPMAAVAIVTTLSIVAAAYCAALVVFPRVRLGTRPAAVNLLFFDHIHRRYGHDQTAYGEAFAALTVDAHHLTAQIADQICANSRIASAKFAHANRAIAFELVALTTVACLALLRLVTR